jgi:hypothetical protein
MMKRDLESLHPGLLGPVYETSGESSGGTVDTGGGTSKVGRGVPPKKPQQPPQEPQQD